MKKFIRWIEVKMPNRIYTLPLIGHWLGLFHWGFCLKLPFIWFHLSWKSNEKVKWPLWKDGLTIWFSSHGGAPEHSSYGWRVCEIDL